VREVKVFSASEPRYVTCRASGGQIFRKFPSGFYFFCSVERGGLRRAIQAVVPVSCARQPSREKEGGGGGYTGGGVE
jgi:hypothetical protein